jgi:hypothetical protein
LGLRCPVHSVSSWQEGFEVSNRAAPATHVSTRPSPSGSLSTRRCTANYAAYQARLARAARAGPQHPFLRKYALYCGGRWSLGVYEDRFAIF